ncbi:MAG: BolA family protein [Rhodospirillaceae bacterium]
MTATTYRDRMEAKLTAALNPQRLAILDDSHRHAGHGDRIAALKEQGAGDGHAPIDGGGETHFRVEIVSSAFEGKSRVERQRMVYAIVDSELRERVHALQLKTLTPAEAG